MNKLRLIGLIGVLFCLASNNAILPAQSFKETIPVRLGCLSVAAAMLALEIALGDPYEDINGWNGCCIALMALIAFQPTNSFSKQPTPSQ